MLAELQNASTLWLLELRWGSIDYRFSSYALTMTSNSGELNFIGGLDTPDFRQRLEISTGTAEANTIALELIFDLDMVDEWLNKGRTIEGAKAELSYITIRHGVAIQSYENRTKVFSGVVISPIFGSPDRPPGHVAFSIERPTLIERRQALPAQKTIEKQDFNLAHTSSIGKSWPFVWGEGTPIVQRDRDTANNIAAVTIGTSPAYLVHFVAGSRGDFADTTAYLMIAGHDVVAQEVRVIDYRGNISPLKTVQKDSRGGLIYSYVQVQKLNAAGSLVDGITNPLVAGDETERPQYWVYWPEGEGAHPNTSGDGALAGAGDLVLKLLTMSAADVDLDAWISIKGWLNNYRLQGYLNDPSIDPYEFLIDELLPLLPIYIQQGPLGARPVVRHIDNYMMPPSKARLQLGADAVQLTALQPLLDPGELVNKLSFRFSWQGFAQSYRTHLTIGAETIDNPAFDLVDANATSSQSIYGIREQVLSSQFVYSYTTAAMMATEIVRRNAYPIYSMQIQTGIDWGWLYLGDVITLQGGVFDDLKAQIIGKEYDNGWVYEISITQTAITNTRHK